MIAGEGAERAPSKRQESSRAESKAAKQRARRQAKEAARQADSGGSPRQGSGEAERLHKGSKKPPKAPAETLQRAAEALDGGWTQVPPSGCPLARQAQVWWTPTRSWLPVEGALSVCSAYHAEQTVCCVNMFTDS